MSSVSKRYLAIVLGAALASALLGWATTLAPRHDPQEAKPTFSAASAANAAGDVWRRTRSLAGARAFASALSLAGDFESLLVAIDEEGLLDDDPRLRAVYRTSALFHLRRFDDAISESKKVADDASTALIAARAAYALNADPEGANASIAAVLRTTVANPALNIEAWLFRARTALDANDLATADAAIARAIESGAAGNAVDLMSIERSIRAGDVASAEERLDQRDASLRAANPDFVSDPGSERLRAMAAMHRGAPIEATRHLRAAHGDIDSRFLLLSALIRRSANDDGQAMALLASGNSHSDWVAADLQLHASTTSTDRARALLARMESGNPLLASIRQVERALSAKDLDAAHAALSAVREPARSGAEAFLLGRAFKATSEPSENMQRLLEAAIALRNEGPVAARATVDALTGEGADALSVLVAANILNAAGEIDAAASVYKRSFDITPSAVAALGAAKALTRLGQNAEAERILKAAIAQRPTDRDLNVALARMFVGRGETAAAVSALARVPVRSLLEDVASAELRLELARDSGPDAVAAFLKEAEAAAPSTLGLARLAERAGRDDIAARAFRGVVVAVPTSLSASTGYLESMTRLGRREEALTMLETAARAAKSAEIVEFVKAARGSLK